MAGPSERVEDGLSTLNGPVAVEEKPLREIVLDRYHSY